MTIDRALAATLVAILAVLVAGYVILADRGRDVSSYAIFLSGPVVSALVGAVVVKRQADVKAVADVIAHQTNSLLTNRLDAIDSQLTGAADERAHAAPVPSPPADTPTQL